MGTYDFLLKMFQILEEHNVYATQDFFDDIKKLVKTDVKKFISDFTKDFIRSDLKEYKRYERLGVTDKQNKRLDGNALFRYEYRNNSNLRCIYMVKDENNKNKTFLLCAFNEDGHKNKGKNSYKENIERAIRIYEEK